MNRLTTAYVDCNLQVCRFHFCHRLSPFEIPLRGIDCVLGRHPTVMAVPDCCSTSHYSTAHGFSYDLLLFEQPPILFQGPALRLAVCGAPEWRVLPLNVALPSMSVIHLRNTNVCSCSSPPKSNSCRLIDTRISLRGAAARADQGHRFGWIRLDPMEFVISV